MWILFSDRILELTALPAPEIARLQTYKGILYVLLTACMVFILVRSEMLRERKLKHELEASLEEKNVLLHEIQHRVKNNLQLISSLLSLQGNTIKKRECREQFLKIDLRVKAMALVQEQQFMPGSYDTINIKTNIEDLVSLISSSWNSDDGRVKFSITGDPFGIPVSKAVPCALIVNELVVNSLMHAFSRKRNGEIALTIARNKNTGIISVSDNGVGFSLEVKDIKKIGLGMVLIDSLVDQLEGRIVFEDNEGTTASLEFPIEDI